MVAATIEEKKTKPRQSDELFLMLTLPNGGFTDDQFYEFCQLNPNLKIERNSKREIIIMALTGGTTGGRNFDLYYPFANWNFQKKKGRFFDSSTGFRLPNGATYSPDMAFVPYEKWNKLSKEQQDKFVPLCPDFMLELRSPSQTLEHQQSKLEEFMENGCLLGWLVDPFERVTHVYRPKVEIEEVPFDQPLFGGQVLEGLQVTLADIL